MIPVLVHHEVNDDLSWRSGFDDAIDFRHPGGERSLPASFGSLAIPTTSRCYSSGRTSKRRNLT